MFIHLKHKLLSLYNLQKFFSLVFLISQFRTQHTHTQKNFYLYCYRYLLFYLLLKFYYYILFDLILFYLISYYVQNMQITFHNETANITYFFDTFSFLVVVEVRRNSEHTPYIVKDQLNLNHTLI